MDKQGLRKMQDEYVKSWRKHSPHCDWTDNEIIEHHYMGDMVTLQYCFDIPKVQARKLIEAARKDRLKEGAIL